MHLLQHGCVVIHKVSIAICAIPKYCDPLIRVGEDRIRGLRWPICLYSPIWQRSSPVGRATIERLRICQGKHRAIKCSHSHLADHLSIHTACKHSRNYLLSSHICNEISNPIADTAHFRY